MAASSVANSWRDDPELVRTADEDVYQEVVVEERWEQLFSVVEAMFVGEGMSLKDRAMRATMRGMLFQAKRKVAADPDNARLYVVDAMRTIAACLRVEPLELFPDLKLAEQPAGAA